MPVTWRKLPDFRAANPNTSASSRVGAVDVKGDSAIRALAGNAGGTSTLGGARKNGAGNAVRKVNHAN